MRTKSDRKKIMKLLKKAKKTKPKKRSKPKSKRTPDLTQRKLKISNRVIEDQIKRL